MWLPASAGSWSLGPRVLAARHDDHLIRLVLGSHALFPAGHDLADDPTKKITIGDDDASAVQSLLLAFAHAAILTVERRYTEQDG